jgi:hypothetical protein
MTGASNAKLAQSRRSLRRDYFSAETIGLSIFILEELVTKFPVAKSMTPHITAAINAPRMKPKKLPLSSSAIFPSTFDTWGPTADKSDQQTFCFGLGSRARRNIALRLARSDGNQMD